MTSIIRRWDSAAYAALAGDDEATLGGRLRKRLVLLGHCFMVVHPPERSPLDEIKRPYDDHWIKVSVTPPEASRRLDADVLDYWTLLRETLLLISAMSVVDYDSCVELLTTAARLALPPSLDLSKQRLHFRFILDFDACIQEQRFINRPDLVPPWSCFENLFQPQAAQRGFNEPIELLPVETPIRVNLHFDRSSFARDEIGQVIDQLTESIAHAQEGTRSQSCGKVRLVFESIYLQMRYLDSQAMVLKATTALLETGVTVETLELPSSPVLFSEDMAQKAIESANLMCAIFNNPANQHKASRRQVNVKRLFVTSRVYAIDPTVYEPLYSALAQSNVLNRLDITRLGTKENDLPAMWLAYALFSNHSSTQVETLNLSMFTLGDESMDRWTSVIEAENPLPLLSSMVDKATADSSSTVSRQVIQPSGTTIRLRHWKKDIQLPCAWNGTVVDTNDSTHKARVLLPGFGICTVRRKASGKKRARIARTSSRKQPPLRNLTLRVLTYAEGIAPCNESLFVSRILGRIGRHLTGLKLSYRDINAHVLADGLLNCSHLRILNLCTEKDTPLRDVLHLFDRGCQIASLEVKSISTQSLESLLDALTVGSTHPVYTTLKELRVHEDMRHRILASAMEKLIQVARENRVLSHVNVQRYRDDSSLPWSELASCNGQVHVEVEAVPVVSRYALLGALHSLSDGGNAFRLPAYAIATIFKFAAKSEPRAVIVQDSVVRRIYI